MLTGTWIASDSKRVTAVGPGFGVHTVMSWNTRLGSFQICHQTHNIVDHCASEKQSC